MILSRSSWVKPSTACASPGLSTRRVLLAAATLRFSSTTSGLFPGICSDSNGSSAWPRRWKPQAASTVAIMPARAVREERSNDHIDEPSGNHDDFLHRLAVREARHRVVSEGEALELLAPGGLRRAHVSAQLAVDLEHQLDFILDKGQLVDLGPRSFAYVAKDLIKPKFLPKCMGDVGNYRMNNPKKNTDSLVHQLKPGIDRSLGRCQFKGCSIHRESFKRVEYFHSCRNHSVVLLSTVIVVRLMQDLVDLEPFLPEPVIFCRPVGDSCNALREDN